MDDLIVAAADMVIEVVDEAKGRSRGGRGHVYKGVDILDPTRDFAKDKRMPRINEWAVLDPRGGQAIVNSIERYSRINGRSSRGGGHGDGDRNE